MDKKLEKLADQMINLTPEESQKLQLIVRAKLMPEVAKQQQQGLLQQANNPMMARMGQRPNMNVPMPNSRMAAQQGLLQRQEISMPMVGKKKYPYTKKGKMAAKKAAKKKGMKVKKMKGY